MDSSLPLQQNPNPSSPQTDPHSLLSSSPPVAVPQSNVKATPLLPKPSFSNHHPPALPIDLNAPFLPESEQEDDSMALVVWCSGEENEARGDDEVDAEPDSRAFVVVAAPEGENRVVTPNENVKKGARSGKMVRLIEMDLETKMQFFIEYRASRILYDGLRVSPLLNSEEIGVNKRLRTDLKAGTLMKEKGLWLHRDKRLIGSIPGVSVGDIFFRFIELCVVGLHGRPQAGIDYVSASQSVFGQPIATSIVYSGGYEDNEDFGDVIVYSGQGGKDKHNKQYDHQKLEGGNLALENSMRNEIELRVIRGIKTEKGTGKVYVYDGLYKIVQSWCSVGISGYRVFKFKLVREPGQPCLGSEILRLAESIKADPLAVRPTCYAHLDISLKRENVPVLLYNDVDNCSDPLSFEYISKTAFPPYIFQRTNSQPGCSCESVCGQNCVCASMNGGDFPHDQNGTLLKWKPLIIECGVFCRCPPTCHNRVSQHGLRIQLEVFRSEEARWGVRSLDPIHAGSFICEFAGVILTKEQAGLFALDGDSLIYPNKFVYKQKMWGDLSMVFPDSVAPTYPAIPPFEYAIDVSRLRNVASYITHSSYPNLMVQPVLYSHFNQYFPHLMIYSMENIPPLKELTLDFGILGEPSVDQAMRLLEYNRH